MSRATLRRVLVALIAALVIGHALYRRAQGPAHTARPAANSTARPMPQAAARSIQERAAQPGSPAQLRMGRLTLQPCSIGGRLADGLASAAAYCASFPVAEDWSASAGRKIHLRVALVRAEAASPDPDVVTFLASDDSRWMTGESLIASGGSR